MVQNDLSGQAVKPGYERFALLWISRQMPDHPHKDLSAEILSGLWVINTINNIGIDIPIIMFVESSRCSSVSRVSAVEERFFVEIHSCQITLSSDG